MCRNTCKSIKMRRFFVLWTEEGLFKYRSRCSDEFNLKIICFPAPGPWKTVKYTTRLKLISFLVSRPATVYSSLLQHYIVRNKIIHFQHPSPLFFLVSFPEVYFCFFYSVGKIIIYIFWYRMNLYSSHSLILSRIIDLSGNKVN